MFRNIFSRSSGSKTASPSKRDRSDKSNPKFGDGQMVEATQIVNSEAERQLFKYDMPTQQRGFTDLIQSHKNGNRFQYVALTGADVEEHSARIRRLITSRMIYSKNEIPIKNLPRVRLFSDSEKFPLSQAIPSKGKEFIHLNKATIIYTPLSSFADQYTTMRLSLMDMRLETNQVRSSVKANTNVQVKVEFAMDHCVPRTDCGEIFLMLTREVSHMSSGRMWGVVQIQLEVMESDYPFMENMREVVGVLALPSTGLDTFDKDPMHLDITMHNNHRMKMQDLYANGDIVDETEPMKEKTGKIAYAKSSMAPKSSLKKSPQPFIGATPDIGNWDQLKNQRQVRVADDEISEEPEIDDRVSETYSIPDSLKKQPWSPRKQPPQEEVLSSTAFDSEEEEVPMFGFTPSKKEKGKVNFKVSDI